MMFESSKTFCSNLGLSAVFRQPYALSHCNQMHGYALEIGFRFRCKTLTNEGWVVDFGSLKPIKAFLEDQFDHKVCIAQNDPEAAWFQEMERKKLCTLRYFPVVGCEGFAKTVFEHTDRWLQEQTSKRAWVHSCEVREHGGNSAIYKMSGFDYSNRERRGL